MVDNNSFCEFQFEKTKAEEADKILDFILDNFMLNEPLSVAVGLTRAECEKEFKEFTKSCLKDGICLVVKDPRNGEKMVALLMAFILKRHENREENVDKSENATGGMFIGNEGDKTNSKWHQIMQILSFVESKIWDFVPKEMECECILDFFVLSVNSEYGQRGIAGQLIEHPLLLEEAKQMGCQGIITDASNHKSQKLFAKHGYSRVYELPLSSWKDQNGKEIFKCKCGTDRITLELRTF